MSTVEPPLPDPNPADFSPAEREEIDAMLRLYHDKRAAVVDVLKIVQRHRGWVSDENLRAVARVLDRPVKAAEVRGEVARNEAAPVIRSVRIHDFGGPEVLRIEDVETEEPGGGDIPLGDREQRVTRTDGVRRRQDVRSRCPWGR